MPLFHRDCSWRASGFPGSMLLSPPAFGQARTRSTRVSVRERFSSSRMNRSGLLVAPQLDNENEYLPGFVLSSAISSFTLFAGIDGLTTNTNG